MASRILLVIAALLFSPLMGHFVTAQNRQIGVSVLVSDLSPANLAALAQHGTVLSTLAEINALTMRAREGDLATIRALPFVIAATPDAERTGIPIDTVSLPNFLVRPEHLGPRRNQCHRTSRLDPTAPSRRRARGCTSPCSTQACSTPGGSTSLRSVSQRNTRERSAGWWRERGHVSSPANMWQHDQNSHGTHVTSTILGYSLAGCPSRVSRRGAQSSR